MSGPDPLAAVELLAVIEEATTPLRHEVCNRLASVRNMAYFVQRKLGQETNPERDPRVADFIEKIGKEVQRTDETLDDWLASIQQVKPSKSDAIDVADCVRLAAHAARLPSSTSLEITTPTSRLHVAADLETLAFALRCLIENAAEAEGSTPVSVALQTTGSECQISVVDGGPGIAEPVRCFERFYTTKPGRLGLGLCMATRIAARFSGRLSLQKPVGGAEIRLCLPLAGAAPSPIGGA